MRYEEIPGIGLVRLDSIICVGEVKTHTTHEDTKCQFMVSTSEDMYVCGTYDDIHAAEYARQKLVDALKGER